MSQPAPQTLQLAPQAATDRFVPGETATSPEAICAAPATGGAVTGTTRKTTLYTGLSAQLFTGDDNAQTVRPATGAVFTEGKVAIPIKENYTLYLAGAVGYENAKIAKSIHETIHGHIGSESDLDKKYANPKTGMYAQTGIGIQWDALGSGNTSPYVRLDGELGNLHDRLKAGAGLGGPLPLWFGGKYTVGGGVTLQGKSELNDRPIPFGYFAEATICATPGYSLLGAVKSSWLFLGPVDLLPEGKLYYQSPQYALGDSRQILCEVTLARVNLAQGCYVKLATNNDVLGKTDRGETGGVSLGLVTSF